MPGLTYSLKADTQGLSKGLKSAEKEVKDFKKRTEQQTTGAVSSNVRNIGGVSLKLQDIAAQVQSGTKASTIMMQQGPQILSVFGPGGAIAGAVLGLGTLMVSAFTGGSDAIKQVKADANDLQDALNKATRIGTADAFRNFAVTATEQIDKVKEKISELALPGKLESFVNLLPGGTLASAGMRDNRLVDQQKLQAELLGLQIKAMNAANATLDIEDQNLAAMRLRAEGRDKEAEKLETEIKMNAELGAMFDSNMAKYSSAYALQQDANIREKYALQEKIKLLKEEAAERERVKRSVDELLEGIEQEEKVIAERRKRAEKERERVAQASLDQDELTEDEFKKAEILRSGDEEALKALEKKIALRKELQRIDKTDWEESTKNAAKLAAIEASAAKDEAEKRKKEAEEKKKESEELSKWKISRAEQEANALRDFIDAANESEESRKEQSLKQIADEAKARDEADAEALKRIDNVGQKEAARLEEKLTLDQKIALAKERVAKAQEKAESFRRLGVTNKEAEAGLAEAQAGLGDLREQQIQRIMRGSTSKAAEERSEKKAQRARARAERILQKRQAVKDHDARARGEVPVAEIIKDGGKAGNELLDEARKQRDAVEKNLKELEDLNRKLEKA